MHVKKSDQIEGTMKRIIYIISLTWLVFNGCASAPSPERQALKDAVWKSDSLEAEALLETIKAKRMPDTIKVDTIQK